MTVCEQPGCGERATQDIGFTPAGGVRIAVVGCPRHVVGLGYRLLRDRVSAASLAQALQQIVLHELFDTDGRRRKSMLPRKP